MVDDMWNERFIIRYTLRSTSAKKKRERKKKIESLNLMDLDLPWNEKFRKGVLGTFVSLSNVLFVLLSFFFSFSQYTVRAWVVYTDTRAQRISIPAIWAFWFFVSFLFSFIAVAEIATSNFKIRPAGLCKLFTPFCWCRVLSDEVKPIPYLHIYTYIHTYIHICTYNY